VISPVCSLFKVFKIEETMVYGSRKVKKLKLISSIHKSINFKKSVIRYAQKVLRTFDVDIKGKVFENCFQ